MSTKKEAGKKKELPEGQKEKRVLFRMVVVLIGIFILLGGLFAAKTALDLFTEEEEEVEVPSGVAQEGATQSQGASGTTATSAPGSTGTTTPSTTTSTGTTPSTSTGTGTAGTTGTSGTSGGTAPTSTTSGTAPAGGTPPAAAAEEEEPAAAPAPAAAEEPVPPATPTTETSCNNGIDDDADGNMDYADRDCIGSTAGCPVTGGIQTQVVWSYVPEEDPAGIPSRRGCCAAAQCRQANGACVYYDALVYRDFNCGNDNNWDRCGPEGDSRYNKHAGDISEGGDYICNGAAWIVYESPEVSCRDGVDNDYDGMTDTYDIDCLGKFCEPSPSKKVWVWTYDLIPYAEGSYWRYWRIYAPGFSFNGLSLAEATTLRAAGCCKKEQCYLPGTGCVDSNVERSGESSLCWEIGSGELSTIGGQSALYKNSFLRCTVDFSGASVSDEVYVWDCFGGGGWHSTPR